MVEQQTILTLLQQKLSIMSEVLSLTREELLLVDLEHLTPLLERKNGLIREIDLVDNALALHERMPPEARILTDELTEVVEAILENERTLEARLNEEHSRLRQELRDLDQETRLRQYLERSKPKGGTVNLKK